MLASLSAYLPRQRWFGGKTRAIAAAERADRAVLPGGPGAALELIRVCYQKGDDEIYAMWCQAVAPSPAAGSEADAPFLEVAEHAELAAPLVACFATAGRVATERGGHLVFGDIANTSEHAARLAMPIRGIGAEQSNTSLKIGGHLMLKLFRKLEPGTSPELEFGRFLTARTRFTAFPRLRGALTHVAPDGTTMALAVLQDFVPNHGDGWTHVVRGLAHATGDAAWNAVRIDARALGATTGAFHLALASVPDARDFAPEPVTPDDVRVWRDALRARARTVLGTLADRLATLPEAVRAAAQRVLAQAAALERMEPPSPERTIAFDKIRVHGDYHLGQTLKTDDGFVLMDFEGEPARTLAERRAKHCALKDVAGMLRSFDYAGRAAQAGGGTPQTLTARAMELRGAFLDGYLETTHTGDAGFLPATPGALGAWIDFFELDKAVYEIDYELNHRPDWLAIPLLGVARILERDQRSGPD